MIEDFLERMDSRYDPTPDFQHFMRQVLTRQPSLIEMAEQQYRNLETGWHCLNELTAMIETGAVDVFRKRFEERMREYTRTTDEFAAFVEVFASL